MIDVNWKTSLRLDVKEALPPRLLRAHNKVFVVVAFYAILSKLSKKKKSFIRRDTTEKDNSDNFLNN